MGQRSYVGHPNFRKRSKPLGSNLTELLISLPGIKQVIDNQQWLQEQEQKRYDQREKEGGVGNYLMNRVEDGLTHANNALAAPTIGLAKVLDVDPTLLNVGLTILGSKSKVNRSALATRPGSKTHTPPTRSAGQEIRFQLALGNAKPRAEALRIRSQPMRPRIGEKRNRSGGLGIGAPKPEPIGLQSGSKGVGAGTSIPVNPVPTAVNANGNGHTNGESNGITKGNSSTTATDSDNELVEYAADILSKEQDKLRAMAENLPKGPEKSGLIELAGENKRGQSLLLTTYPDAQLIKDQGKFFDALSNAGDDPKLILKALKRNFDRIKTQHNLSGSSNMGVEFTLEAHHELYAIESALGVLNVSPQVRREVLQIQLDRGVRYGDHDDNVRGLFKDAHREAHPQGFQAPSSEALVERVKLLKNPSAREIADAMNDVAIHSRKLALQAAQGKSQIQTAWDLINGILSPQEIKIFTDLGINFADTKDPLWQQIRRFIEGSGRLQHFDKQASAIFESMTLESMNIA